MSDRVMGFLVETTFYNWTGDKAFFISTRPNFLLEHDNVYEIENFKCARCEDCDKEMWPDLAIGDYVYFTRYNMPSGIKLYCKGCHMKGGFQNEGQGIDLITQIMNDLKIKETNLVDKDPKIINPSHFQLEDSKAVMALFRMVLTYGLPLEPIEHILMAMEGNLKCHNLILEFANFVRRYSINGETRHRDCVRVKNVTGSAPGRTT
jgi:hypothetical protein